MAWSVDILDTAPFSLLVWMIDEYMVMVMVTVTVTVMVMVQKWVIQGVLGRLEFLVSAATKDVWHLA